MNYGYIGEIRKRIKDAPFGAAFVSSDFSDIADSPAIRQSMARIAESGKIRRVINGVYDKPEYSEFLAEYVAPNPDEIAKAIARNYNWTIAPSGNTALNLLGLSTQVTSLWTYVSDGPYRNYQWDNMTLEFKHRANREITGLSYKTNLAIQALKALGKENVTPVILETLSDKLTEDEKRVCLKEAAVVSDWIYSILRIVCKE